MAITARACGTASERADASGRVCAGAGAGLGADTSDRVRAGTSDCTCAGAGLGPGVCVGPGPDVGAPPPAQDLALVCIISAATTK
ncbi:MAG: hypothetical protein OXU71_09095 [Gammaproteobacteria bacterium]|nr:hypothetical protein [Gammaproteobacteria bacterium]